MSEIPREWLKRANDILYEREDGVPPIYWLNARDGLACALMAADKAATERAAQEAETWGEIGEYIAAAIRKGTHHD